MADKDLTKTSDAYEELDRFTNLQDVEGKDLSAEQRQADDISFGSEDAISTGLIFKSNGEIRTAGSNDISSDDYNKQGTLSVDDDVLDNMQDYNLNQEEQSTVIVSAAGPLAITNNEANLFEKKIVLDTEDNIVSENYSQNISISDRSDLSVIRDVPRNTSPVNPNNTSRNNSVTENIGPDNGSDGDNSVDNGNSGGNGNSGDNGNTTEHDDNGHGNDADGVDESNPGQGVGGPTGENNGTSVDTGNSGDNGNSGGNGNSGDNGNTTEHDDNGHGNDADGVDESNPGQGVGGPTGENNFSIEVDDFNNMDLSQNNDNFIDKSWGEIVEEDNSVNESNSNNWLEGDVTDDIDNNGVDAGLEDSKDDHVKNIDSKVIDDIDDDNSVSDDNSNHII